MTEYATLDVEGIERKPLIGTDAEGAAHHLDRVRRVVYVVSDGEVVHTEDVSNRGLDAWVRFVRQKRGWDDCRYGGPSLVEKLVAGVGQ